jgi:peptidoglycan-associated lipoprotein
MKRMTVVLASLLVAACATSQKSNISQEQQSTQKSVAAVASTTAPSPAETELGKLNAEIQQLQQASDYFDYNKYSIKSQYMNVIRKEADFIKSHKNDIITLQGNADERGSDVYNLTLGEKRAEAVEKALVKFGVPAGQIKLVTLGKGKPRLTCHAEKCWKENRRVDFLHNLG